jgi:hypothetical protein
VVYARRPKLLTLRSLAGGRLLLWSAALDLGDGLIMVLAVAPLPMRDQESNDSS